MKKIFIAAYLIIAATCLHAQKFEQLTKLVAADRTSGNLLGNAVAISGNYAVVGASGIQGETFIGSCNCAYVFEKTNGEWIQKQKLFVANVMYFGFGYSVAINGNYIVIGVPGDNNSAGAAYIFKRNASGTWVEEKKLVAPDGSAGDLFGNSVSITSVYGRGDESYVLIGAPGDADFAAGWTQLSGAGSAYFFSNIN